MDSSGSESKKQTDRNPFDVLAGKTKAINEDHQVARVSLTQLCVNDPRWEPFCIELGYDTGIGPIAQTCKEALGKLTDSFGINTLSQLTSILDNGKSTGEGRRDLLLEAVPSGMTPDQVREHLQALMDDYTEKLEVYSEQLVEPAVCAVMAVSFVNYVQKVLRLPWAWLARDLNEYFTYAMQGYVTGDTFTKQMWVEPVWNTALPPLEIEAFSVSEGDSPGEVVRHLTELKERITAYLELDAVKQQELPAGTHQRVIEKKVEWMYRSMVQGESIRSIARKSDDVGTKTSPKNIKSGIEDAIATLSVSPLVWHGTPEDGKLWQAITREWAKGEG